MEYSKEEFIIAVEGIFSMISSVEDTDTQDDLFRILRLRCDISIDNLRLLDSLKDID